LEILSRFLSVSLLARRLQNLFAPLSDQHTVRVPHEHPPAPRAAADPWFLAISTIPWRRRMARTILSVQEIRQARQNFTNPPRELPTWAFWLKILNDPLGLKLKRRYDSGHLQCPFCVSTIQHGIAQFSQFWRHVSTKHGEQLKVLPGFMEKLVWMSKEWEDVVAADDAYVSD
jgi:hypothetical protein